jgi:hypothetical protein
VAIKISSQIPASDYTELSANRVRALREVKYNTLFKHPNVVETLDSISDIKEDRIISIMELCEE